MDAGKADVTWDDKVRAFQVRYMRRLQDTLGLYDGVQEAFDDESAEEEEEDEDEDDERGEDQLSTLIQRAQTLTVSGELDRFIVENARCQVERPAIAERTDTTRGSPTAAVARSDDTNAGDSMATARADGYGIFPYSDDPVVLATMLRRALDALARAETKCGALTAQLARAETKHRHELQTMASRCQCERDALETKLRLQGLASAVDHARGNADNTVITKRAGAASPQ